MNTVTCQMGHLAQRCAQRGVPLSQAEACIVSRNEDGSITVDVDHEAYPRKPTPLTLAQRAANFTAAAAQHVAAGMPRCTDEQVAERYAICQACEHLVDAACIKCGCPVVREKRFVSKLAWADQGCPVGKWGPVLPDG